MNNNVNLSKGFTIFIVMAFWSEVKHYLQSRHSNESELGNYKMNNKRYVAVLEQPFKSLLLLSSKTLFSLKTLSTGRVIAIETGGFLCGFFNFVLKIVYFPNFYYFWNSAQMSLGNVCSPGL